MSTLPRPRSLRERYTVIVSLFAAAVLTLLGVTVDLAIRHQVRTDSFQQAELVASGWSDAARDGRVPRLIPTHEPVGLVQIVNARRQVVNSSATASATIPLSRLLPPPDSRLHRHVECPPQGRCILLQAVRVTPTPEASVVYAGLREPHLLATHDFEYAIAAAILLITGAAAWITRTHVGRTLRPVEAITTRISQITLNDLSPHIPVPSGGGEIAQLATTTNHTLTQLESAVEDQRQFACTTSHELRTPVTGLRVQLEEALLRHGDIDAQETLQSALTTIDRLEAIINDLMQVARLRADNKCSVERIDVGELVTSEVKAQVGTVVTHVHAAPGQEILGSRMQLVRVLGNLLANAQRHAASRIEVTVEQTGNGVAVTVTDDGPGIPPADRERVFQRFVRLDDSRLLDPGGSGLGLAISRDIAHAHRGTLELADSPRGARFVLWLPLMRGCSTVPDAQPELHESS
ncbi:sensor histidine kinase [Nonomuraea maritima]|uniref:sensor histidine kinase n=1 Tax=Nonomuraea maritima TaxID=683260 RepID=UPI00371BD2F0